MFSDQYEFLIEDFENKLHLIYQNQQNDFDLIDGDFKIFIRSLFENLGNGINFRDIETRLKDLQKIDLDAIYNAAKLFDKAEFYKCSYVFNSGKKIYLKDELDDLLKELKKMKKDAEKLGKINLLFQLELYTNSDFEQMICILGDKAPTIKLQAMIDGKLKGLSDNDIKILWSYIKEEFRNKRHGFTFDTKILGTVFFKPCGIDNLRKRITQYLVLFRPKIIVKRLKAGQTSTPIFSFGIARILGIHKSYVKDLNLNELMIIRIINRVIDFWENILNCKKDELCKPLGLSPEGCIVSYETMEDKTNKNTWFESNTTNRNTSYKLVLYELRRLLKITDYYITRQTDIEKALYQYKFKYEIFAKEKASIFQKKNTPNELYLQKELCSYLLERDIYSYGKLFGTSEIDLMVDQPGETYVIETKIFKNIARLDTIERHITSNIIQLSEYLDKETSAAHGILVIYNTTDVLIQSPNTWLQKRFWILPINISGITACQRKKSIRIEESDIKKIITCIPINAEPSRRNRKLKDK